MEFVSKMVRSVHYSFLLVVALIGLIIFLLSSPTISDPLVNLLLGGIVPGSDRVIAPDTMIMVATVMAGLTIVVALLVWLARRISFRRAIAHLIASGETPVDQVIAIPLDSSDAVVTIHTIDKPIDLTTVPADGSRGLRLRLVKSMQSYGLSARQAVSAASVVAAQTVSSATTHITGRHTVRPTVNFRQFFRAITAVTLAAVAWAALSLIAGVTAVFTGVLWLIRKIHRVIVQLLVVTVLLVELITKKSLLYGNRAWIWLRPYAERFDGWLELRYRATAAWVGRSLSRSEVGQVVVTAYRSGMQNIRQLLKQIR